MTHFDPFDRSRNSSPSAVNVKIKKTWTYPVGFHYRFGHPAKILEGAGVAAQEVLLLLRERELDIHLPRVGFDFSLN